MILGKWNKSVILSYIGLLLSVIGINLFIMKNINVGLVCLIFAGVCDMFDGTVARRCKRTKEERQFGIELDSLIDVFSFVAVPIVFLYSIGLNKWYFIPVLGIYAIYGIARLAHFNTITENDNKPAPYYHGLPITVSALIFPLFYLLSFIISKQLFIIIITIITIITALMFIVDFKVLKPKLRTSIILLLIGIIVSVCYLFVL